MVFKDVIVKSVDQKSPYVYPTRRIEIETSEKRIYGPTRAATLYEYNQKSEIPTNIPLDNEISISVKKLNKNKLEKFLKGNGLYASWSRQLTEAQDRMKYSPFCAHIIQPTITNIKKKEKDGTITEIDSGADFLRKNSRERARFLRLIIKMQADAGLDVITIPYLKLPLSEFKELVKAVTKQLHTENREPMFVFDLNYQKWGDKFQDAMDFLMKKTDTKLIAFPNHSFASSAVSYDILSEYVESDVAFFTFDVERAYRVGDSLSKMHSQPFLGSDVYSIETPRYFPPSDESDSEPYEKTKDSINFFNPDNLLIEPSQTRIKNRKKILEEIEQVDNKWLQKILGDYDNIKNEQDKIYVINAISKVHELKSSNKEFDIVQKRIKSEESKEYVKEKQYIEGTLDKLKTKKQKKRSK